MSLKERAHQLYAAKYNLLVIYTYREFSELVALVQLANTSFVLYMKDRSTITIHFIGFWGVYMDHPQNSGLDRCVPPTQTWRYDGEQLLYANNEHMPHMHNARKFYHNLCLHPNARNQ